MERKKSSIKESTEHEHEDYDDPEDEVESDEEEDEDRSTDSVSSSPSRASIPHHHEIEELSESETKPQRHKYNIFVCPEDLDPDIYQKISQLRHARIYLENDIENQRQVLEKIHENISELGKLQHSFELSLDEVLKEMSVLAKNRQAKINNLKGLVILKADQIQ